MALNGMPEVLATGSLVLVAALALVMVLAWRRGVALGERLLTVSAGRELAYVLGGLSLYKLARRGVESPPEAAMANASRVIELERSLGLFIEPRLQRLVIPHDSAVHAFSWHYAFGFQTFVAAGLLWLYLADPPHYRLLRNCLGISALLAVTTVAVFPAAPPRLMATSGVVDTFTLLGRPLAFTNEFAAVPSLHVGWSWLTGHVIGRSIGGRWGLAFRVLPGTLMLFSVMITGNHYWLDGALGAGYCMVTVLLLTPMVVGHRGMRQAGLESAG